MTKVEKTVPAEGKRSYDIIVTTKKDKFKIPVVDVRDGETERQNAESILNASKVNNSSRFMRPTFAQGGGCYQTSRKRS